MTAPEAAPATFTQEAYDEATAAWLAAKEQMDKANEAAEAAEKALYEAEEALAAQEAVPGIAAYLHTCVPARACRIGYQCKVHGPAEGNRW